MNRLEAAPVAPLDERCCTTSVAHSTRLRSTWVACGAMRTRQIILGKLHASAPRLLINLGLKASGGFFQFMAVAVLASTASAEITGQVVAVINLSLLLSCFTIFNSGESIVRVVAIRSNFTTAVRPRHIINLRRYIVICILMTAPLCVAVSIFFMRSSGSDTNSLVAISIVVWLIGVFHGIRLFYVFVMRGNRRFYSASFFENTLTNLLLILTFFVVPFAAGSSLTVWLVLLLVVNAVAAVLAARRTADVTADISALPYDRNASMVSEAAPSVLAFACGMLSGPLATSYLAGAGALAEAAILGVGWQIFQVANLSSMILAQNFSPELAVLLARGDMKGVRKARKLFVAVALAGAILLGGMATGLSAVSAGYLLPDYYDEAAACAGIILVGRVINIAMGPNCTCLTMSAFTIRHLIGILAGTCTYVASVLLYAGDQTAIAYAVFVALYYVVQGSVSYLMWLSVETRHTRYRSSGIAEE